MGKDPLKEFKERDDRARQMENLLTAAAKETAAVNATDWTAKIDSSNLDFSMFNHDQRVEDFTNQQLFHSELRQYGMEEFEDDNYMANPAKSSFGANPSSEKLKLLAFALKNHGDYNGRENRLKLADGGLEIDLIESQSVTSQEPRKLPIQAIISAVFGTSSWTQSARPDRPSMAGSVKVSFRLNHNLPHMVVNPNNGSVKLPTSRLSAQKLTTEGGADHFHIYASPTYQTDVLYIFTPDVLSAMNHRGGDFAYTFFDNKVEIYAPPSVLQNGDDLRDLIFTAINLTKEINQQAARYRDDRANDYARTHGNLASRGRRMHEKLSLPTKALIGVQKIVAIIFTIIGGIAFTIIVLWIILNLL